MTTTTLSFAALEPTFTEYLSDIVYSTMVTVDAKGRPRARIVLPIWEIVDGRPVGWLATYRTPIKTTHLATNPHTTFSYWNTKQNAVLVDAVAQWISDQDEKTRVWHLHRSGSPRGVGYDPGRFWSGGPTDPEYHLLRFDPYRVQLVKGTDLSSTIWREDGGSRLISA